MLLPRLKFNDIPELKLNDLQLEMRDQVTKKVNEEIYEFEEINCPICDKKEHETIGEKDRFGLFFKTNICIDCGMIYTSPRMIQQSYNQFYNIEYRKLYTGEEKATEAFFEEQNIKGEGIYEFLESNNLIPNRSLLVVEIGCGAGGILNFFRKKGHEVKGFDLGEEYLKFGKNKHNLDLEVGTLANYKSDRKCDIIIYSHVLEHILDINKELQAIKQVIDENTIIYIEVPGVKHIHENYQFNLLRYFQNAHTFHFTLETLTNLFVRNGFELVTGTQFVQSAFKYTGNSGPVKSDYFEAKNYLLKTEKYRKLSHTLKTIRIKTRSNILALLDKTNTRKIAKSLRSRITSK